MFTRLGAAALSAVALITFSACSGEPEAGRCPTAPAPADSNETFDGDVTTDSIKVGPQDVVVPKGITLPETTIVSDSQDLMVMMIDEDPAAVIEAVTDSAAAAGYEKCEQPSPETYLWVGQGNAVSLLAVPGAQQLVWGPESMAGVLARTPA